MMKIRHVRPDDWAEIVDIETSNFLPSEAATPEAIAERIEYISDTFLVAEIDERLVGYIEGPVISSPYLTDDLFHKVIANPKTSGYIAVTSLSVAKDYQKQGIGTTLIAALKDLAIVQGRQGITLTCHDHLIKYYQLNGFNDEGLADSQHGGTIWYNMVWKCP